jgi:hypothetical protein
MRKNERKEGKMTVREEEKKESVRMRSQFVES